MPQLTVEEIIEVIEPIAENNKKWIQKTNILAGDKPMEINGFKDDQENIQGNFLDFYHSLNSLHPFF